MNGPLHGLRNDAAGGNGVYAYGPNSTFPVNNFGATNYWVDIIFPITSPDGPAADNGMHYYHHTYGLTVTDWPSRVRARS